MSDAPVVVIGGGIAGLAAAWQLHQDGVPVRLLEGSDRVGGKIRTTEFMGRPVDEAADAFLARVPHGIELATELGLADELISPATRKAQVWIDGRLQPLPEPNVLGIPLDPVTAAEMLGPEAGDALAADLARVDPDPVRSDDTIGSLVRRRLGDRIHEALVDPLVGAINAGDTDHLELAASSPQILAAANAGPSLVASFQQQMAARRSDAPVFHSFAAGMGRLVRELEHRLAEVITTNKPVTAVEPTDGDAPLTVAVDGGAIPASSVIVATPAPIAARLLGAWPGAASFADVPLVSVTLVGMAWPAGTLDAAAHLSGFVVPRSAPELTITACSYASNKWPHLGGDIDMLRVSVGHANDQVTPGLDDEELLAVIAADLETALGITAPPIATRISRWANGFPQYRTGHLDRLAAAEAELNPAGIFLAGMSHRGIGIPANIDQGRRAARAAAAHQDQ